MHPSCCLVPPFQLAECLKFFIIIAKVCSLAYISTSEDNVALINTMSTCLTVKTLCFVTFDQVQARRRRGNRANMKQQGLQGVAAFASVLNSS